MRPRNLKLEGFTCFRDPIEIDFTGMDVFVIAGPTGAGKTTITDAICYALYGKVPRGTTVKDLIARDATAMKVQLEFEARGHVYRVHRSINRKVAGGKKSDGQKLTLDLSPVQLEELISGEWDPMGDRVANINDAIEDAVGLDFDSFTKCVLLPQGRFAEFLTGKPDERRKIFIDLLDLGIYDRIMRAANARAAVLDTQIADREHLLRDEYAQATEEALAATREQLAASRPALETERQRRDALQHATAHAATVMSARTHEKERRAELEAKAKALHAAEIDAKEGAATLAALTDAVESAEKELMRSAYDAALHNALVRADSCAKQAARAHAAVEQARAVADDRDALKAAERAAGASDEKHRVARAALEAAEQSLREAERADVAEHLRNGLKKGDPCPVCGGVVGTLPKVAKSAVGAAQKVFDDARKAETAAAAAASKATTAVARAQEAAEGAAKALTDAEAHLSRAEQELQEALPAGVPADPKAIGERLDAQERARAAHADLTAKLEQARRALEEHRKRIAGSEQAIAALKATIAQLEAAIEADRAEGDGAIAQLKQIASTWQWGDVIDLIDAKKSPHDLLQRMLGESQRAIESLSANIARLEGDETAIEKAIARATDLRRELDEMKDRRQLCRDLAVLLRANNFQQFVIEEAMQVLAEAATEHLHTLFARYAIRVSGGDFTVVDHWQADQERPAKTLSGGETFVASLALALALAERLPELRSAAASSLESLFLDEGFGTLDTETLETVIEALEGLRSEERMVGVITHVPEMTERIEQRIIVRKSPSGSTIEVMGA
jgi:exonuclease SbcC